MKPVHLTTLCSDLNAAVFREVVELVFHGFRHAGADVSYAPRSVRPNALNVLFASHRLPESQIDRLGEAPIAINFEQLCAPEAWGVISPAYTRLLARARVVDYSERNRTWLREQLGIDAELMMLGHVPELERIPRAPVQDIDVLFYGTVTARREPILRAIRSAGLRLRVIGGEPLMFAEARDGEIARSRVVLNLHAHEAKIFEQVRVNYLLINGKAVVSEVTQDTEIPAPYRETIDAAPDADTIVERCRLLARDDVRRRRLEDVARDRMRAIPQSELLRRMTVFAEAFGRRVGAGH